MPLGNYPWGIRGCVQDSATAISKGHVVLLNAVADATKVVRAAAENAPKVAGIAMADCAGQNKDVLVCFGGICLVKNTSGSAIGQGVSVISDDAGGVKALASESTPTMVGTALEDAADGDLFSVLLSLQKSN